MTRFDTVTVTIPIHPELLDRAAEDPEVRATLEEMVGESVLDLALQVREAQKR